MRGEWTRATLEFGPTVADQADYTLPASLNGEAGERILEVTVDGRDYGLGSPEKGRGLQLGDLFLRGYGLAWISHDSSANEQLSLYPTPTESGLSISALCVVEPEELSDSNLTVKLPYRFRSAIVDYAAAQGFGSDEDNAELRTFYEQRFEDKVAELLALRNSRARRGGAQIQIEGIHF